MLSKYTCVKSKTDLLARTSNAAKFAKRLIAMRLVTLIFLLFPILIFAQNKDYDKLEMLYDQGHYKKVLRSTKKLLRKEVHQKAILPHYYQSLAQLQLYRDDKWRRKNPDALEKATTIFQEVKKRDANGTIFKAHTFEIQSLKRDYGAFLEELEEDKKTNAKLIEDVKKAYKILFLNVDDIKDNNDNITAPPAITNISDLRKEIVKFAYKYRGTGYRSGGNDPSGFDCSGFVNYVFNANKIELPRTSRDQQKQSRPLKAVDTKPGDLVFFANGASVNHVGIVVENKNGAITMIHSSTSQGIVVTEIDTSNYWKNRVHSYGTFIQD